MSSHWLSFARTEPIKNNHFVLEVCEKFKETCLTPEDMILSIFTLFDEVISPKIQRLYRATTVQKEKTSDGFTKQTSYYLLLFSHKLGNLTPTMPAFDSYDFGISARFLHWQFSSTKPWRNFEMAFGNSDTYSVIETEGVQPIVRKLEPLEKPLDSHLTEAEKLEEAYLKGLIYCAKLNEQTQTEILQGTPQLLTKVSFQQTLLHQMVRAKAKNLHQKLTAGVKKNEQLKELAQSILNKMEMLEAYLSD